MVPGGLPEKGALDLIDEALWVLRRAPWRLLPLLYVGSLPFVLGLLYFWADMSQSAFAAQRCLAASLGLAGLFIWMKCWQAVFGLEVQAVFSRTPGPVWNLNRVANLAGTQALYQSMGLVLLPLALVLAVPFGWCFAFYQHLGTTHRQMTPSPVSLRRQAWDLALFWPRQNHVLMLVLFLFGVFVLANIAIFILYLPWLLNSGLGIETRFILSGIAALNTTYLTAVLGLTYLCLDPLVKTVYALRCYYAEAVCTGDDLAADLRRYQNRSGLPGTVLWAGLLLAIVLGSAGHVNAAQSVDPAKLDRAVDRILQEPAFAWRLPRSIQNEKSRENGWLPAVGRWLESALQWLGRKLKALFTILGNWKEKIAEWLKKLFPQNSSGTDPSGKSLITLENLLWLLLAGLVLALVPVILAYVRRAPWRPRPQAMPIDLTTGPAIEERLAADTISAADLPVNRWLVLADEWLQKGDLRLALRAFYLATLAHLAEMDLLRLARYKTNREYVLELRRKAGPQQGLWQLFAQRVRDVDRFWYGMHQLEIEDVRQFSMDQERIRTLAQT